MTQQKENSSLSGITLLLLLLLNALIIKIGFIGNENWYWGLLFTVPLLLIAIWDARQKKHVHSRNYPVIGHMRYFVGKRVPELKRHFLKKV